MSYTYPKNYKVRSVSNQFKTLKKHFPSMPSVDMGKKSVKGVGEGTFLIPHWKLLGSTYTEAVEKVMNAIKSSRSWYDYRNGNWGPKYLKQLPLKETFWNRQKEEIIFLSAQFGQKHAGESVETVHKGLESTELPFGLYECLIMLLTHPERLQSYDDLWIDCPGDEYSWGGDGVFSGAPGLNCHDGRVDFGAKDVSSADGYYGSASGFVPQALDARTVDALESSGSFTLERAISAVKEAGYKVIKEI